ncbi:hypothetical protein BLOT_005859 [Blomia tropicalis]|nr:hypothetical protein BLOT_005859 [Blomia tropicalis]
MVENQSKTRRSGKSGKAHIDTLMCRMCPIFKQNEKYFPLKLESNGATSRFVAIVILPDFRFEFRRTEEPMDGLMDFSDPSVVPYVSIDDILILFMGLIFEIDHFSRIGAVSTSVVLHLYHSKKTYSLIVAERKKN